MSLYIKCGRKFRLTIWKLQWMRSWAQVICDGGALLTQGVQNMMLIHTSLIIFIIGNSLWSHAMSQTVSKLLTNVDVWTLSETSFSSSQVYADKCCRCTQQTFVKQTRLWLANRKP